LSDLDRQANILGALALIVDDRASGAIAEAVRDSLSHTAAAALSALDQFLERPTIDLLRQVLGLTPSGTVRLIDRLEEGGYVTRQPGPDGRSRTVTLTTAGRRAATKVTAARASVLTSALERLSPDERATYEELTGRVLGAFVRESGATKWGCRLCDVHACEREQGHCPVMKEVARREMRNSSAGAGA
jgi:DNA-binding MarR family transcriptional regulator